jgi:hypothetical protein
MSQKSTTFSLDDALLASPPKRAKLERKQFTGPSYIRMQVLSFAIALIGLPLSFIDPANEKSISRAAKELLEKVSVKALKKGLLMQARKGTRFGKMGGNVLSHVPRVCLLLYVFNISVII